MSIIRVVGLTSAARAVALNGARRMSAAAGSEFSQFTLDVQDGIALVKLDAPEKKMNTLTSDMTGDFIKLLSKVEADSNIKGVVLISAKSDNFIAGADIGQLAESKTAEELAQKSREGQLIMDRIANSKKPFVAAINGACLGGGLEVALACHYRIATADKKTNLGLPEVMLGLLPGAGGTQRLPKLVGIQKALDMMLTGKNIKADRARKMGLVDQVADKFALESAAMQAARGLVNGSVKPKRKEKALFDKALEDTPMGRSLLFKKAAETVTKKTGGHYPAPLKILECVKAGVEKGHAEGSKVEAENFGKLGMTSESKSLISIFFGNTALKKNRFGKPSTQVKNIGVVGAGLMGAGIAQVSIDKGYNVLLKDVSSAGLAKGEEYIRKNFDAKLKKKRMSQFDRDTKLSNLYGLTDESDVWKKHYAHADLVIEAVFEDMKLKHKVIQQLEEVLPEHAVFATNTSALPIAEIAKASKRPQNVIGMHYFSPVDKMPLLEIITHDGTSKEVASIATEVGIKQGKTVIVVKDVPGFYVNRCLGPMMVECTALLGQGVGVEQLDKAMLKYGLPVGPCTLADEVGIDVATHVNVYLSDKLDKRMDGGDTGVLSDLLNAGFKGRKTGKGFYVYGSGKKGEKKLNPEADSILNKYKKTDLKLSEEEIQNRMIGKFVNEAIYCLQDNIIENPVDGDIGAVFGVGFPPFRGGPFRLVDQIGSTKYSDMLSRFADKYGEQFAPAPLLVDMAKTNKKFHSS